MARWRNHLSQLFKVLGFKDIRQTELHTAEPLVPEPTAFEFKLAIAELKSYKSPDIDHITTELIKAVGGTIHPEIHKLIISIWNKKELPEEWKESIIVLVYKKGDKTYCGNYRGISPLPNTYKMYPTSCCQG